MAGINQNIAPTFQCSCGFVDYVGQFSECPVCVPVVEEADPDCFFLRQDNTACRIDGHPCPFMAKRNFDICPKLHR